MADPTTFGLFDVVAYDFIDQENDPKIEIRTDENDQKILEVVVGGAVVLLWPADAVVDRINKAMETEKNSPPKG